MTKVELSLDSNGGLLLALPGEGWDQGSEHQRFIPLQDATALKVIRDVLFALGLGKSKIGLEGAPTESQVVHWQRHREPKHWDPRCPHCQAERSIGLGPKPRQVPEGTTGVAFGPDNKPKPPPKPRSLALPGASSRKIRPPRSTDLGF